MAPPLPMPAYALAHVSQVLALLVSAVLHHPRVDGAREATAQRRVQRHPAAA